LACVGCPGGIFEDCGFHGCALLAVSTHGLS
jgi:hypothetical protein